MKFDFENWPEEKRKKIFILILIFLMSTITLGWLVSLKFSLKAPADQKSDNEWRQISNDVLNFFQKTSDEAQSIKNQIKDSLSTSTVQTAATATIDLSPAELEKLKEKILEKTNN
ncbi:MAG TPA: hypothetical protein VJG65_00235 [Patescibacteria group bacterium]|nr:hypothetical protein [Patescibacteria group bacterium]